MPELPEVENYRKFVEKTSLNRRIKNIDSFGRKTLSKVTPDELNKRLAGKSFKSAGRHGKYLFIGIDKNTTMVMHFGMTGYLKFYKDESSAPKNIRARFIFSDGNILAFNDARMFGRIAIAESKESFIKKHRLGVDPVESKMTYNNFKKILAGRRGIAKSILMDQSIFAGIGNVYSDEILFHSGINPMTALNNLNEEKLKIFYKEMMNILKKAIKYVENEDNFPENYLVNTRRNGKECPLCGGEIKLKTIGGRSSYFCTKHQK